MCVCVCMCVCEREREEGCECITTGREMTTEDKVGDIQQEF